MCCAAFYVNSCPSGVSCADFRSLLRNEWHDIKISTNGMVSAFGLGLLPSGPLCESALHWTSLGGLTWNVRIFSASQVIQI